VIVIINKSAQLISSGHKIFTHQKMEKLVWLGEFMKGINGQDKIARLVQYHLRVARHAFTLSKAENFTTGTTSNPKHTPTNSLAQKPGLRFPDRPLLSRGQISILSPARLPRGPAASSPRRNFSPPKKIQPKTHRLSKRGQWPIQNRHAL
jgi:hypothetical protein